MLSMIRTFDILQMKKGFTFVPSCELIKFFHILLKGCDLIFAVSPTRNTQLCPMKAQLRHKVYRAELYPVITQEYIKVKSTVYYKTFTRYRL